jgi:hypothetical protein
MNLDPKLSAALASYGRSFLAAATALWATGNTDPKALVAAGLAAVLPVALRALNKKDPAFGLVANFALPQITKQINQIIDESNKKAKKAVAKKATAKKKP